MPDYGENTESLRVFPLIITSILKIIITIIIIIFLHGLGRFTCSGIDALPSFPRASMISSSRRFIVEGVFRESGVFRSYKMVFPFFFFVFGSHVLYSEISSSFLTTSLLILSSLVYPLTFLRKRISAASRRVKSRVVVTHSKNQVVILAPDSTEAFHRLQAQFLLNTLFHDPFPLRWN